MTVSVGNTAIYIFPTDDERPTSHDFMLRDMPRTRQRLRLSSNVHQAILVEHKRSTSTTVCSFGLRMTSESPCAKLPP